MQSDFDLSEYHAVVAREEAEAAARALAPKKKMTIRPEEKLHIAVCKMLTLAINPPSITNSHGVCWFSIQQESGRRSPQKNHKGHSFDIRGQLNRAKGVRPGVPDIHVSCPQGARWIELKAGKNDASRNQDAMHANLQASGALTAVCWSVDEVLAALRGWGVPLRVSA